MYLKTWQTRTANKYKAVKKTVNGVMYDSTKEANKAVELEYLKKAKQIKNWQRQVKEELRGQNGTKLGHYYCDFLIEHLDGTKEYLEIKSKITATDLWKWKWKLLQDKHKDNHDIRFTVEY